MRIFKKNTQGGTIYHCYETLKTNNYELFCKSHSFVLFNLKPQLFLLNCQDILIFSSFILTICGHVSSFSPENWYHLTTHGQCTTESDIQRSVDIAVAYKIAVWATKALVIKSVPLCKHRLVLTCHSSLHFSAKTFVSSLTGTA